MKKVFILLLSLFAVAGFSVMANAALIDNTDGTVTDDDLGIMWLQSPGPDANWAGADAWAASLVFAGYNDWRLASALDFDTGAPDEIWNSTNNEFGHLYGSELSNPANLGQIVPLQDYNPVWYWTGTVDSVGDPYAFFWSFDGLWLNDSDHPNLGADAVLHVTAVRDISVDTCPAGTTGTPPDCVDDGTHQVPEPGTMLLLGTGLIGLAYSRRKLNK